MKHRKHHNNTGYRQIQRGKTIWQVARITRKLGINGAGIETKPDLIHFRNTRETTALQINVEGQREEQQMFNFLGKPEHDKQLQKHQLQAELDCAKILINVYAILRLDGVLTNYIDDKHNKDVVWMHTECGKRIPLTLDKTGNVDRMYDNKKTAGRIVQHIIGDSLEKPWGVFAIKGEILETDTSVIRYRYSVASPEYIKSATSWNGNAVELFRKIEELTMEVKQLEDKYDFVIRKIKKYAQSR